MISRREFIKKCLIGAMCAGAGPGDATCLLTAQEHGRNRYVKRFATEKTFPFLEVSGSPGEAGFKIGYEPGPP